MARYQVVCSCTASAVSTSSSAVAASQRAATTRGIVTVPSSAGRPAGAAGRTAARPPTWPGAGPDVASARPGTALGSAAPRPLAGPPAGMRGRAEEAGPPLRGLRGPVRSGNTPPGERRPRGRGPPHTLVTTPASLYILLTAE